METTTTDQKFPGAEASLAEPHFDEEATLLSARPVVPLTTLKKPVNTRTSFPRPWILGLALAGTLLVGIFAMAIYYSPLNRNDSNLFEEAASGQVTSESEDGFSGPAPVHPDKPAEVRKEVPAKNQPVNSSAEGSKKPVARLVAVITEKRSGNQAAEGSGEDRRAARRQARREQRRAERARRDGRSSDDVLRIRDIFEGSPRP